VDPTGLLETITVTGSNDSSGGGGFDVLSAIFNFLESIFGGGGSRPPPPPAQVQAQSAQAGIGVLPVTQTPDGSVVIGAIVPDAVTVGEITVYGTPPPIGTYWGTGVVTNWIYPPPNSNALLTLVVTGHREPGLGSTPFGNVDEILGMFLGWGLGKIGCSGNCQQGVALAATLVPGVNSVGRSVLSRSIASESVALEAGAAGRSGLAAAGTEAFHYGFRNALSSIKSQGLRAGTYATPNGTLSPLQAQIDLALSPNQGLRNTVLRIDLQGLRQAGFAIPEITPVGRTFGMPGGGYEMQFPYPIPPEFIQVVAP
jgi:hypothetical protein